MERAGVIWLLREDAIVELLGIGGPALLMEGQRVDRSSRDAGGGFLEKCLGKFLHRHFVAVREQREHHVAVACPRVRGIGAHEQAAGIVEFVGLALFSPDAWRALTSQSPATAPQDRTPTSY